jgi:DNA ligase-1
MLSASLDGVDLSTLRYPLLLSPKLDGVRCIVWEGVAYSRNAKPIRNRFVQKWAEQKHNLDGELIVGSPTDPHCLNNTQSGVMSFDGEPDFTFHMFDVPDAEGEWPGEQGLKRWEFQERIRHAQTFVEDERIVHVLHKQVLGVQGLMMLENQYLDEGYEGVMLRDPNGPYKHGRSTLREGYLMKLKRFTDGEAVVTGLEQGHVNENLLQRDELGRAKRTRHQENLAPSGMVGTILARDEQWGDLRISPGTMSHQERVHFFNHPDQLVGKTIHWRSFGYGVKDKPRFPRYYGVREDV